MQTYAPVESEKLNTSFSNAFEAFKRLVGRMLLYRNMSNCVSLFWFFNTLSYVRNPLINLSSSY